MGFDWVPWVLSAMGAEAVTDSSLVQSLWGGYGELLRLELRGGAAGSVILKRVVPPTGPASVSDARKRRSYEVEQAWYQEGSRRCPEGSRVAACYAGERVGESRLLLLEDLSNAGFFPRRPPGPAQVRAGLSWLAHFHARFLGARLIGLWKQGSYWHRGTREEEWRRMPAGRLKELAGALDDRLRGARYQTLVHGDSKPSNFLWSAEGGAAAVDFQYVGPGCGIRDVAYFLDCCLGERGCERDAEEWLDRYFGWLRQALEAEGHESVAEELEREWRALFPVAWSDYCRFYQGWGRPGPLGSYSQRQLRLAEALL